MRYKKLKTICEGIRNKNLELLDNARRNSTNMQAVAILQDLYTKLRSRPVVFSVEAFESNVRIYKYLQEISADLTDKCYTVAKYRTKKLDEEVVKNAFVSGNSPMLTTKKELKKDKITSKAINAYAKKGGLDLTRHVSVGELYNSTDLYNIMVAQLQDKVTSLKADMAGLDDEAAPEFTEFQRSQIAFQLSTAQQELKMYGDEGNRESYIAAMATITEKDKELISQRKYTEEQAQVIQTQYDEVMARRISEKDQLKPGMESFLQNGKVGVSAISGVSSVDIKKLADGIKVLEKNQESSIRVLEELEVELKEVEDNLRTLLRAREKQDAAECEINDGKITMAAGNRVRILTKIKTENQKLSEATKELIMRDTEISQMESLRSRSELQDTLGVDVEKMAVSINALIKKGNEMKQKVDDAYAAAFSTDIEKDSITGGNVLNVDATTGKNIGKFDDLRIQLNMGKAER